MFLVPGATTSVLPEGATSTTRPRRRRLIGPATASGGVRRALATYLFWIAGVAVLGLAWLVPETGLSAGLGWMAALLMVYALRTGRGYLPAFCAGVVGHVIGFHWVYRTVIVFGGFGMPAAALVFALFAGLGALQFLAIAVIDHHLDRIFDAVALRSATAVVLAELLTPRLFPWHFGHTQIAFTPFVQVAGIGGAMAVSFLLFWMAEVLVRVVVFRERRRAFLVPVAVFGVSIVYGMAMMDRFGSPRGEQQEVVIAQGHVAKAERRDLQLARQYLARIFDLSCQAAHPGSLVVWPEGAVPAYIPAAIGAVGDPPILPWVGDGSAYLVGAYSFLPNEEKFNTAFAVYPEGEVPMPYFKQVLIPFGEYMPLASYFPWLNTLNAKAGVFGAGTETKVFAYPMHRADGSAYTLKVSPLDLLRGHRSGPGTRGDAEGGRAAGQHLVRRLVRPQPGPASASPDRRVPRDREPPLPGPLDDHRLERGRSTRSAVPSPRSRPSPRGPSRRRSVSSMTAAPTRAGSATGPGGRCSRSAPGWRLRGDARRAVSPRAPPPDEIGAARPEWRTGPAATPLARPAKSSAGDA